MGWICLRCEAYNFDNDHRCVVCELERQYGHQEFIEAVRLATDAQAWERMYQRSEAKYKRLQKRHQKLKAAYQQLKQDYELLLAEKNKLIEAKSKLPLLTSHLHKRLPIGWLLALCMIIAVGLLFILLL